MARARNIKPSFFQNEELGELNPLDRLAFIGMWTIADFKGCIELRAKRLKVQLLPYDECDFETIVNNLEQSRFISTYSVLGQRYIKIINFEKHQNPHKNERESGRRIPDISERDDLNNKNNELQTIENNPDKNGTARADSLLLIPDSPNPQPAETPSRINALDDGFHEFWNHYPKKVGKDAAQKAWTKKKPKVDEVIKALSWQVESAGWTKSNGDFIPNPATYLNEGRWKDEPVSEGVPF
jgi:hypothetical protein